MPRGLLKVKLERYMSITYMLVIISNTKCVGSSENKLTGHLGMDPIEIHQRSFGAVSWLRLDIRVW